MYEDLLSSLNSAGTVVSATDITSLLSIHLGGIAGASNSGSLTGYQPLGTAGTLVGPSGDLDYPGLFRKRLESTPNVFDIRSLTINRLTSLRVAPRNRALFGMPPLALRVDLPARLQRYHEELIALGAPSIEQFQVLTRGSVFAAYVFLDDINRLLRIGHEFRELVSQLDGDDVLEGFVAVGPCPIHVTVHVVFAKSGSPVSVANGRVLYDKYELIIISDRPSAEAEAVVLGILENVNWVLTEFYFLELFRSKLLDDSGELTRCFTEVGEAVSKVVVTPWWKLRRALNATGTAKAGLVRAHSEIVSLESALWEFGRLRSRLLDDIEENEILKQTLKYFEEQVDPDVQMPTNLPSAMGFYAGELQALGSARSVLLASGIGVVATLLGALLGAMLAAHFQTQLASGPQTQMARPPAAVTPK